MRTVDEIEKLIGALSTGEFEEKRKAANELGNLKGEIVLEALVKALEDPEEDVRISVALALGQLRNTKAIPSLKSNLQEYLEESHSYPKRFGFNERHYISTFSKVLGHLGDKSQLFELLVHYDGFMRKDIAEILADLGENQWNEIITGQDSDFIKVAETKDRRVTEYLLETFYHGSKGYPPYEKFIALAKLADKRVLDTYIRYACFDGTSDSNVELITFAKKAINKIGENQWLKACEIFRETNLYPFSKEDTINAVSLFTEKIIKETEKQFSIEEIWFSDISKVQLNGILLQLLDGDDPLFTFYAAVVLSIKGDKLGISKLGSFLFHDQSTIRRSAAIAMGLIECQEFIEPLQFYLREEHNDIIIGSEELIKEFQTMIREPESSEVISDILSEINGYLNFYGHDEGISYNKLHEDDIEGCTQEGFLSSIIISFINLYKDRKYIFKCLSGKNTLACIEAAKSLNILTNSEEGSDHINEIKQNLLSMKRICEEEMHSSTRHAILPAIFEFLSKRFLMKDWYWPGDHTYYDSY